MQNPYPTKKADEVELVPGVVARRSFTVTNHEPVTATTHTAEFTYSEAQSRYLCSKFTVAPDLTTLPPNTEGVSTEAVRLATTTRGWGIHGRLRVAFSQNFCDQGDLIRELPNQGGVEPWGYTPPPEYVAAHKRDPNDERLRRWVQHLLAIGEALYGEPTAYLRNALKCSMGTAIRLSAQAGARS